MAFFDDAGVGDVYGGVGQLVGDEERMRLRLGEMTTWLDDVARRELRDGSRCEHEGEGKFGERRGD